MNMFGNSGFTKYVSPATYWQKAVWLANRWTLPFVESIFAPPYDGAFGYPPVFFIGAPRSGSTLMFQVITNAFDLGYLSNRHCYFFGAPSLAEYVYHPLENKLGSDYRSEHGRTKGLNAPSECGEWWYRFFRRDPPYVTLNDVEETKMRAFRRSLLALSDAMNKPVIFKNLYASFRLHAISRHIPEALFIVTKRREIDNGHSLLEVRKRVFGSYEHWWSMSPPNVDALIRMPPWMQVIEQIREIHALIRRDVKACAIAPTRLHEIQYEEFCKDVHGQLRDVHAFLASHGCRLSSRLENVPKTFSIRSDIRIDQHLYDSMAKYVADIH